MIKLELDPTTGKAVISGLTPGALGAVAVEELSAITLALGKLDERLDTLESTAVTRTSYTVELRPAEV